MHCHLTPSDVVPVVLDCHWPIFTAHAHKLLHTYFYVPTSDQNSDIDVGFSGPYFLNERNNMSIRRRFTLWPRLLITWPWTSVVHRVSSDQRLYQIWAILNTPLYGRPRLGFIVGDFNHWVTSVDQHCTYIPNFSKIEEFWPSYSKLKIENLGAVVLKRFSLECINI